MVYPLYFGGDDVDDSDWCDICGKPPDLCDCFSTLVDSGVEPTDVLDIIEGTPTNEGDDE